jgi:hypothetical protein
MSHYSPVKGRGEQFYRDVDGYLCDTKRYDEVSNLAWDLTDALEGAETITSVAYDPSGLTVSSEAHAGNVTTLVVTGTGTVEVTVTLSTGRILQENFRLVSEDQPPSDYAGG